MSRYLFVTFDGGGAVPPALGLAHELAERGQVARFLGHPVQRERIEQAGFAFASFERSPAYDSKSRTAPWYEQLPDGVVRVLTEVILQPAMVDDVLSEVERWRPDALVVDYLLRGPLIAAELTGLPSAALGHMFYGFLAAGASQAKEGENAALNAMRAHWGLAPVNSLYEACARIGPVLMATLRSLDPAAAGAPLSFRFLGPIFEPSLAPERGRDPTARPGRPRVLVSLTTLYHMNLEPLLQRVLDGLAGLPLDVLVTAGGVEARAMRVPENTEFRGFIPHHRVLSDVSLVVGHGGHATTMAALAHAIPLVILPMFGDQPLVAASVEAAGAGRALPLDAPPDRIRDAVQDVLGRRCYREAARSLGSEIGAQHGAVRGAEELTGLLSLAPA